MAYSRSQNKKESSTSSKQKRSWVQVMLAIVRKIGAIVRGIIKIVFATLQQVSSWLVQFTAETLGFAFSPSTYCNISLAFLALVFSIALGQWYGLGTWLGSMFGVRSYWGYGVGVLGMALGALINWYEMEERLYKLSDRVRRFYSDKNVNTEFEGDGKSAKDLIQNRYNYDHQGIKKQRRAFYLVEMFLMVVYTLIANASFWGLVAGVFALTAPENTLDFVSHTISLMGAASSYDPDEPQESNNDYGL